MKIKKKKLKKLTVSEREVLEVLWEAQKPLTSSEIVTQSVGKSWKPSYIHILIKSLLEKEMIQVAGFQQTTKNYARTFEPTITHEEYMTEFLKQQSTMPTLTNFVAALVEKETDKELIDELSRMLEEKRKELEQAQELKKDKMEE